MKPIMGDMIGDGWGASKERRSFKRTLRERSSEENSTPHSIAARRRIAQWHQINSQFYVKICSSIRFRFLTPFPRAHAATRMEALLSSMSWRQALGDTMTQRAKGNGEGKIQNCELNIVYVC
jgi:hypothetical protein